MKYDQILNITYTQEELKVRLKNLKFRFVCHHVAFGKFDGVFLVSVYLFCAFCLQPSDLKIFFSSFSFHLSLHLPVAVALCIYYVVNKSRWDRLNVYVSLSWMNKGQLWMELDWMLNGWLYTEYTEGRECVWETKGDGKEKILRTHGTIVQFERKLVSCASTRSASSAWIVRVLDLTKQTKKLFSCFSLVQGDWYNNNTGTNHILLEIRFFI